MDGVEVEKRVIVSLLDIVEDDLEKTSDRIAASQELRAMEAYQWYGVEGRGRGRGRG